MTFKQLNYFLPTQIPNDRSDFFLEFPANRLLLALRYKYGVIAVSGLKYRWGLFTIQASGFSRG